MLPPPSSKSGAAVSPPSFFASFFFPLRLPLTAVFILPLPGDEDDDAVPLCTERVRFGAVLMPFLSRCIFLWVRVVIGGGCITFCPFVFVLRLAPPLPSPPSLLSDPSPCKVKASLSPLPSTSKLKLTLLLPARLLVAMLVPGARLASLRRRKSSMFAVPV